MRIHPIKQKDRSRPFTATQMLNYTVKSRRICLEEIQIAAIQCSFHLSAWQFEKRQCLVFVNDEGRWSPRLPGSRRASHSFPRTTQWNTLLKTNTWSFSLDSVIKKKKTFSKKTTSHIQICLKRKPKLGDWLGTLLIIHKYLCFLMVGENTEQYFMIRED